MVNYESIPKKIRKIWNQTIQNENDANRLNSGLVKNFSFNYNKKVNKHTVYDGGIGNSDPIIYKVTLNNLPDNFVPNIKVVLESTSSSSIIDYYLIGNVIYVFYQGAATITIDLYIINPQDYR